MSGTVDNTKPYESQRYKLGDVSLRDRRISMLRSKGMLEGDDYFLQAHDEVLKGLNGHSNTPLKDYLEETLYRPKIPIK